MTHPLVYICPERDRWRSRAVKSGEQGVAGDLMDAVWGHVMVIRFVRGLCACSYECAYEFGWRAVTHRPGEREKIDVPDAHLQMLMNRS